MDTIVSVHALEVLDSRGYPTIEVIVTTASGSIGVAMVPSGASTGEHEALELRDQDPKRYLGKGVTKAVSHVNGPLAKIVIGRDVCAQRDIDTALITADGTPNKSKYGANAILGISLAVARAASVSQKMPLYRYLQTLSSEKNLALPVPMMNIINGGAHADNDLDFQEFMIRPSGIPSFKEGIRAGAEVFHTLKSLLKKAGYNTAVGDEGGFAPKLCSPEETMGFVMRAIENAGYKPGKDFTLALDCAASEFFDPTSQTYYDKKQKEKGQPSTSRSSKEQIRYLDNLCSRYPIDSIEDGLDQNDWEGWQNWTAGTNIQIVGDDIFVTNASFLQKGITMKAANAILIKVNQVGSLSETLDTIALAKKNGYKTVISHRSGETEDTFIADLAVGTNAGQIKTGSLSRSERVAKYNRLLKIAEEL